MSLSTAKCGALIGVLISVTTIPAAANVAVSAAYGDGSSFNGSLGQLGVNIGSLLVAGTLTLSVQRLLYLRRRGAHCARRAGAGPKGATEPRGKPAGTIRPLSRARRSRTARGSDGDAVGKAPSDRRAR